MNQDYLITRCQEGDRQAQRLLFEQTSEQLYRFLLRLTANPDDACDLAQETYLRAFSSIARFDGRSSFKTWLFRIALNETGQLHRRSRTLQRKLATLNSKAVQQWERASRETCRLDVNEALARLEPDDRAILLLRYHEGLDYRAIAETAGIPAGTVASRLNRARERMRLMLNAGYGQPEESRGAAHLMEGQKREFA